MIGLMELVGLTGRINEVRKTFESGDITGEVSFGQTHRSGNGATFTTFRVKLSNGREGHGKYSNPKNVRVTLKAQRKRYGRRID